MGDQPEPLLPNGVVAPILTPFEDDLMLYAAMSPFRGGTVGGLNIERDIRDMTKANNPKPIDPAAVEILATRTAVLSSYGLHSPNAPGKVNPANKKQWEKWSTEAVNDSKEIEAEAAKGAKADTAKIKKLLNNLDARCQDCHNKFRDE